MVHKRAPRRLYGINLLFVSSKNDLKWTYGKCNGLTPSIIAVRALLLGAPFSHLWVLLGPQNDFAPPVEKRTDAYVFFVKDIVLLYGEDIVLLNVEDIASLYVKGIALLYSEDIALLCGDDIALLYGEHIALLYGEDIVLLYAEDIALL